MSKFIKIPLLCASLFILNTANAQYLKIKELRKEWNETTYLFPEFSGKPAAEKINTFLQGAELDILPGKFKKTPFENILPAKDGTQGITFLEGKVLRNTSSVVSVIVNSEYTSASLNEHTSVYNFDAQTGENINFSSLFSPAGYQTIKQLVNSDRQKRLSAYLKTLNLKDEEAKVAYKTYKDCLEEIPGADLNQDRLSFEKEGLQLEKTSCFPDHYGQALSDKANIYINKLSIKTITPYLSAYGKHLLLQQGETTAAAKPEIHEGIYKGKINDRYPITLLITRVYGNTVRACYFYDQVGQKINLSGTIKKPLTVSLTDQTEVFELNYLPKGGFSGTWSKGGKKMKVELN